MPLSAPSPTQPAARPVASTATAVSPPAAAQSDAGFAGEVEQALAQAIAAVPAPELPGALPPDSPMVPALPPGDPAAMEETSLALPAAPGAATRAAAPTPTAKAPRSGPKLDGDDPAPEATATDAVSMPIPVAPPAAPDIKPPSAPPSPPHAREPGSPVEDPSPLQSGRDSVAPARDPGAHTHAPAPPALDPKPEPQPTPAPAPSPLIPDAPPALSPSSFVAAPVLPPAAASGPHQPPPALEPSPAPPPPAAQIAASLVEPIQVTLAAPAQGGPQTLTIQLKPAELGRVEVRIERTGDGPAKIEVAVERTDTLMLLVRDQSQMHQALDQAGLPQDGRTLHFSLAADPAPAPAGSSLNANSGSDTGAGSGHRSGYGQPGQSGSSGQDPEPRNLRRSWIRSGLDITA